MEIHGITVTNVLQVRISQKRMYLNFTPLDFLMKKQIGPFRFEFFFEYFANFKMLFAKVKKAQV